MNQRPRKRNRRKRSDILAQRIRDYFKGEAWARRIERLEKTLKKSSPE